MIVRPSTPTNPRLVFIAGATLVAGALVLMIAARRSGPPPMPAADFTATVITSNLDTPWDLAWGADSMIWVAERGGRVSRVDPLTGRRTTAGEVGGLIERGEGGLMGIALHPDFPREPWLYAMHSYSAQDGGTHNRLVRLRWNGSSLVEQRVLLDGIPGGAIHNGARLAIGPDRMLYITTGDGGDSRAQDSTSLAGKVLRVDLDGRVPPGNPFNTAVWSSGHRNGQGLVFHPATGALYETEHGSGDNDEVNLIRRGANYGWPAVRGACDEAAERAFCGQHAVVEPLTTWTPTVAIAGADFYRSDRAPALRNSLVAASLNGRTLWRITVSDDGTRAVSRAPLLSGIYGRLRDVLVAPGGDIYIATSNRDGRGSPVDADDRIIRLSPR